MIDAIIKDRVRGAYVMNRTGKLEPNSQAAIFISATTATNRNPNAEPASLLDKVVVGSACCHPFLFLQKLKTPNIPMMDTPEGQAKPSNIHHNDHPRSRWTTIRLHISPSLTISIPTLNEKGTNSQSTKIIHYIILNSIVICCHKE